MTRSPAPGRTSTFAAIFVGILLCLLSASRAQAYPWLIRHDHTGCAQCHMDPSGSGLLTAYGREQGEEELIMRYHPSSPDAPQPSAGFLFGAFDTPEWLLLGAGFRAGFLDTKVNGAPAGTPGAPAPGWTPSLILMQADVRGGIRAGALRASASLGVVNDSS